MCPGEGRGPPRRLQLPEPYVLSGCTCGNPHRGLQRYQQRDQDVRFRDQLRRAPLLRTFSHHDVPPEESAQGRQGLPTLPPTPTHVVSHPWTSASSPLLPQRVPPLKRHLTHTGAFGLPPVRVPSRPSPSSEERHDSWMPTTRRLLLEPAPHRLTVQGVPYGGPALRTPPPTPPPTPRSSAFRAPSYYCSGEIVYELRPGPVPGVSFSVPVFGSMVVRSPQEADFGPQMAGSGFSGGVPPLMSSEVPGEPPQSPKQCLRVLRPDELEQRNATLASPAPPYAAPTTPTTPDVDAGHDVGKRADSEDYSGASTEVAVKVGSPVTPPHAPHAPEPAAETDMKSSKRQWLLRVVRENFNEQIGTLVERFVRRPRHDKSVRRVPGIGRKVNINLQDFWRRSSGQERQMKTKDLLSVYTDSGMDWRAFQRWLTKDLQFMPSCAKLTALSLDIYQRYWSANWVHDVDVDSPT